LDSRVVDVPMAYMSKRQLSPDVIVPTTVYYLQVDTAVSAKKSVQARFKQFDKRQPKSTTELATTYTDLLVSLVEYFITHYVPVAT
jgi:hypothetical protein